MVKYSSRFTTAQVANLRSSTLRVTMMLKESIKASVGGGSSMEGTSAVGCANKIVFPQTPVCCTSGLPLPSLTCFQQALPRDNNVFVASVVSRTFTHSRPIQLSFTRAFNGTLGRLLHKSRRQGQHAHTMPVGSPMPAHGLHSAHGSALPAEETPS